MIEKLNGVLPAAVMAELTLVLNRFKIDSALRLSHFLANCEHESGGFKVKNENLNYGEEGLLNTFKSDFDINKDRVLSPAEKKKAKDLARHSEPIANFVYANQNGNGNEASGDGWKYRGRGYIQLTGKGNYALFDKFVDDDILNNPDLVSTKYPLLSAAWFWDNKKLNLTADKGSTPDIIKAVRKTINGGIIGLDEVAKKFVVYYNLLK